MTEILLTEQAFRSFSDRIARSGIPTRLVRLQPEGGLVVDGKPEPLDAAQPEVAWLTADAFYDGSVEPFFAVVASKPSIRWLHSPAAGVDLPHYAGLTERGVRLTTSHVNAIPIAEYVVGAVLAQFQRSHRWREAQTARAWRHHEFREVWGSTWLVVGLGAIGTAVATRARAFGARVLGVRRHPTGEEAVDELLLPEGLRAALPRADVVVLAAPGTAETYQLVDDAFLAALRPGSVLVNVARGSLVDEAALLRALTRGVPEAAILDVFATEPLPAHSPFWDHPRVVVTPHSSAGGSGRLGRAADLFVENLGRYRRGQRLHHEVDPADLPMGSRVNRP